MKLYRSFYWLNCRLLLPAISTLSFAGAQTFTPTAKRLFTPPHLYNAFFTTEKPTIDGSPGEKAWQQAAWSDYFTDIEGDEKPMPQLQTRMKMLWDDSCLYIAAKLEEPHIWATLRQQDAIIFQDNDFEVFIDPYNTTHSYFEIEVNAFNTIFDLLLPKPYRNGGSALIGYDVQHLQSAVSIQGTINIPDDKDTGWTVEMAIPFRALTLGNEVHVPTEGEQWRINFSRVEWDTEIGTGKYIRKKDQSGHLLPEHNWVWSPQGIVNMHYPERWGYVQFSKKDTVTLLRPADETNRNLLWLAYYRQKAWQQQHGSYAISLAQLGIPTSNLRIEATAKQFIISVTTTDNNLLTINQDGFVSSSKK